MHFTCSFCGEEILPGEQFVNEKKPGTEGKNFTDYNRWHNRHSTDCWAQRVNQEVLQGIDK